tara:strand:- start:9 stop:734 length:726 start_codon:yes stop_codon:yes gene_type:complete
MSNGYSTNGASAGSQLAGSGDWRYFLETTGEEYVGKVLKLGNDYYTTKTGALEGNSELLERRSPLTENKKPSSTGKTSYDSNHNHTYILDSNGNGYTEWAFHPKNKHVKHRHEVFNFIVQSAASNCWTEDIYSVYSCEQSFEVSGIGPHTHSIGDIRVRNNTQKRYRSSRKFGRKATTTTTTPQKNMWISNLDVDGGHTVFEDEPEDGCGNACNVPLEYCHCPYYQSCFCKSIAGSGGSTY